MYDIRQFKPAMFILLAMGMTGFCLAAQAPGLWIISMAAVGFNGWLITTGRFAPLPRLIANTVTLLLFAFSTLRLSARISTEIVTIGQFLVFLQLVKLYEQRANRDYAQLLVLSLLLMVAAAISTASLLFGILFISYLFLSLYCCLLFHLKVEADHAKDAIAIPEKTLNPQIIRQDQRFLTRSMRRLTFVVASVSLSCAVFVFLAFPRGTGASMLGQFQVRQPQTLTGFSEQVSFQQVARISQNQEKVAFVTLSKNNKPVKGTSILLLRGLTLDFYTGNDPNIGGAWQWIHYRSPPSDLGPIYTLVPGEKQVLFDAQSTDVWRQTITLLPNGTRVLFAMPGVSSMTFDAGAHDLRFTYSSMDGQLESQEPLGSSITYTATSTGLMEAQPTQNFAGIITPDIDPKIREFAERPEVSGADADGLLYQRRSRVAGQFNEQIARNIEHCLQSPPFSYTLDLTDTKRLNDEDPLVAFLYRDKRGHCEYFAGAMTLLCQSLGIPARMVIGFKCDEYNQLLGQYVVKQSHAHAWCEVLTTRGWMTFDPTSARDATPAHQATMWEKTRNLLDFLDYKWSSSVIAYDRSRRANFLNSVENKMGTAAGGASRWIASLNDFLDSAQFWFISSKLIALLLSLLAGAIVGLIGWFFFERWKLRRRAARIGLQALPHSDQIRLARQLGFYDELMQFLERRQIARKKHQTPLEFSQSLAFLPSDAYDAIWRMTEVFYRVRYGRSHISAAQQRHLRAVIARLESTLPAEK